MWCSTQKLIPVKTVLRSIRLQFKYKSSIVLHSAMIWGIKAFLGRTAGSGWAVRDSADSIPDGLWDGIPIGCLYYPDTKPAKMLNFLSLILKLQAFTSEQGNFMQRQDLWATPLWYFEVPHALINPNDIAQEAYAHQKSDRGVAISNVGGYQSSALNMQDRVPQTITKLMNFVVEQCQVCAKEFGFERRLGISNYWININGKNNYNKVHIHSSSILSGCYYAVVPPRSGNIVLHNRPETSFILDELKQIGAKETGFTATSQAFEPKAGSVLIFPGWLQHSVEENKSDQDRISIAFNLV